MNEMLLKKIAQYEQLDEDKIKGIAQNEDEDIEKAQENCKQSNNFDLINRIISLIELT